MTIFVFCMNLLCAAFALAYVVEFSTLLIGSLVYVLDWWKAKAENGA